MRKTEYSGRTPGSAYRTKTPIKTPDKYKEVIAEHDNKIYSLATEASRLKDRTDARGTKAEPFEAARMEGTQRAQEKYDYHIKNLENDKTSLSKRLNIVLTELDKITAEKAEYDRQMKDQVKVSEELEEKISKSESLSKVLNKNLQDDLKYEKELNEKLRDEVSRYEAQKSQLFVQLRENQGLAEQFERESQALAESIKSKEIDISGLVELHEKTKSQLRDAEDQVLDLKRRLQSQDANIDQLTGEIQTVEEERNDLIARMNSLTNQYETYVNTMTQERDELARTTKKHIKLLTAKILSEKLNLLLKKQYYGSMSKMTNKLHEDSLKKHMTNRLLTIFKGVMQRDLRAAFQKFYCILLNWPSERQRREQLLEHLVSDQSKRSAFAGWLQACRAGKEAKAETSLGARKLLQTLQKIGKSAVEEAFLRLKHSWVADKRKKLQLNRILVMKYKKSLKIGFETWRIGAKHVRQRLVYEYLANQMAEDQVEQVAFHKFKDGIRQNRIDKQVVVFRAFRYWKTAKKRRDQIHKSTVIALKIEDYRTKALKRRIFHTLQQNRVELQLQKLSENLSQAKNRHAELDNQLAATKDEQEAASKKLALKRVSIHLMNRCYGYFEKWRRYVNYYYRGKNKLNILLYTIYRHKLGQAFGNWRKESKLLGIKAVSNSIEKANEQIRGLELEQLEKSRSKKEHEEYISKKIGDKLIQNFLLLDHQYLRHSLRRWNANAKETKRCEGIMRKMCRRLKNIKRFEGLERYRRQIRECKQAEMFENRVQQLHQQFTENMLRRRIATWRAFKDRRKRAKARAKKAIIDFQLAQNKWAFQQWRRAIRDERIAEKLAEQGDLKKEELRLNKNYENIVEENSRLSKRLEDHKDRIKRKYIQILWNTAVRQKKLDRQSAFENWRFYISVIKQKEHQVKKVIRELLLAGHRQAFNKWLQLIREKHIEEKKKSLEEEKIKMKIGKNKSKLELSQRMDEKVEAEKFLERAKKSAAHSHDIAARVIGHLIQKRDVNVYLPLQQAILRQWKDISDKEKHLSEKLTSLARRHIYEHIFIKLKNATIQKKEVEKCLKAFRKMTCLSGKSFMRDAFDKWKNFTYASANQNHNQNWLSKQEEIEGVQTNIEKLNDKLYSNGEMIIMRRKKEHLMHDWVQEAARARFLKDKTEAYSRNRKYIRLKFAIQKWRSRTIATEKAQLKYAKAETASNRKILRNYLDAYRKYVLSQRSLPKALARIARSFGTAHKLRGVTILKNYSESHQAHNNNNKEIGITRFTETAERIFRSRLIIYLGLLSGNSRLVRGRSDKLARLIVALYLSRARDSIRHLRNQTAKIQLVDSVEHQGEKAQTLEALKDEIAQMEDILHQEGYEEKEFLRDIDNIQKQKDDLIRKAIARWVAYQRGQDNVILALDAWKKQTKDQVEVKDKLRNICNFYENNPLKKGFQRLRNYARKVKEAYKGTPKEELIEECCKRGKVKAAMVDQVNEKKKNLAIAEEEELELSNKHSSSKLLALNFIIHLNNGTLEKALHRWRSNINKTKLAQLRLSLDEVALQIRDVITDNDDLEERNVALSKENEELRLLSLESIDLAKSMKELNRQKEQLSVDLADRASTIKKLLEDNRLLNEKLSRAQAEASSGLISVSQLRYTPEKV